MTNDLITRPATDVADAVELFDVLIRAAALCGVHSQRTLRSVRSWIEDRGRTGLDTNERDALLALLDHNIRLIGERDE